MAQTPLSIIIVDRFGSFAHALSLVFRSENIRTHVVDSYGPALTLMQLCPIAAVFLKFDSDPLTALFIKKAKELSVALIFTDESCTKSNGNTFSAQPLSALTG